MTNFVGILLAFLTVFIPTLLIAQEDTSRLQQPGFEGRLTDNLDIRHVVSSLEPVITNSIGMTLNLIPAGEFKMGSLDKDSAARDDERPQHRVSISTSFYFQNTEVTQGQWTSVMGTRPWIWRNFVQEGSNYAADYVSWSDAVEFCRKLSSQERVEYRLPTEAEWEYACRGGSTTEYSFGDSAAALGTYAWFDENTWDVNEKHAHEVGKKHANALGLYDMHGNVWEWCSDRYGEEYYRTSPTVDPQGASVGSRVYRGGGWISSSRGARSAFRLSKPPGTQVSGTGFRVLRSSVK